MVPRRDDEERQDYYMASMLMLLKPWRSLVTDLKDANQSWSFAFHTFVKDAPGQVHATLSAIQYFHKCDTAAKQTTTKNTNENVRLIADEGLENMDLPESSEQEEEVTEESLAALIASRKSWKEELHGRMAVEIAKKANFFDDCNDQWKTTASGKAAHASQDQLLQLKTWNTQLQHDVQNQDQETDRTSPAVGQGSRPTVEPLTCVPNGKVDFALTWNGALQPLTVPCLQSDQRPAFEIIMWHFEETMAGRPPLPLRMVLYGEGGTGKSKVIQTVTHAMTARDAKDLLIKSAYTGIAASLIDVRTVHRGRAELLSEEGRRNGDDNNSSGGGDPLRSVYADTLELHGSDRGRTEVGGK